MAIKYFSHKAQQCWRVDGTPLPIGQTIEMTTDCWLFELHLVNDGAEAATVSVYDLQVPPVAVIPPQTLQPGGMLSAETEFGRYLVGGISVSTSAAGVNVWMIGGLID